MTPPIHSLVVVIDSATFSTPLPTDPVRVSINYVSGQHESQLITYADLDPLVDACEGAVAYLPHNHRGPL